METDDLLFEQLMNSDTIPEELEQQLSYEDQIKERIDFLKNSIKHATHMELVFLNDNLEYLITVMLQNNRIRKDYEYHKELKKTYRR